MTDDKPAAPARRDLPDGLAGRNAADPLALFPTESEVATARKAEPRARAIGDRATRSATVLWPRSRGWRLARAGVALAVVALAIATSAIIYFGFSEIRHQLSSRATVTLPDPPSTLVVETTTPGWSVVEGGKVLGTTPLSVVLPPGVHALLLRLGATTRSLRVTLPRGAQVVHHLDLTAPLPAPTAGALRVDTVPPGAAVALDGVLRGPAPVRVDQLAPGDHTVVVASTGRVVSQRVAIIAGETATLLVPFGQNRAQPPAATAVRATTVPPTAVPAAADPVTALPATVVPATTVGWVTVMASIELQVYDGASLVGSSRNQRLVLTPGTHTLRLVNTALGFDTTSTVTVRPGVVVTVAVQVPNGSLSVNAVPWAEVLLDGTVIGETPIANYAAAPGSHELVFRNPRYPEQRRTVVVSPTSSTHVGVDMRQ
jgi:hypothetical protein